MARGADPLTYAGVVALGYFPGISNGALAADDRAVREIEDALGIAERAGNDHGAGIRPDGAGRRAGTPPHGRGA